MRKNMVSLEIIQDQINRFLETETPEVFSIRGAWGTGKTYAWRKYLFSHKKQIKLDKYSYVSLFGIKNLDALKFAIFSNCVNCADIQAELANRLPIKVQGKKLLEELKNFKGFNLFGVSIGGDFVAKALSYLSVEKTIICLDDFERMHLDAQDVLGLISELKEQKACKVVLILNDEGLSDDAKKKYNTYREKVIDKEFNFLPTPEECTQVVFEAEDYAEILTERCCKIGIKNIRIIMKIQQFKDQLKQFLENTEPETKHNVLSSLVLFTYSLYTKSDEVPDFEFIKSMNSYDFMLGERRNQENENDPEKQKRSLWKNILQDYGYSHSDEMDIEIARSVERGYFVDTNIKREIDKHNDNIKIGKKDRSHTEAWDIFHNSFDNNADDLVQKMYSATKNHVAQISQVNLSASLLLLRELGADDKADELIELVISSRIDADYFNLNDHPFRDGINDQKMIDRFSEVFSQRRATKTPLEVLKDITPSHGWEPQDEEVLASLSVDDYYNLFTSDDLKGEHLTVYISRCLEFGRYQGSTERQKLIATNAAAALKKIGLESDLNKLRIKKFGI